MVDKSDLVESLSQDIASYVLAGEKKLLPDAVFEHFSYEGLKKYNLEELILLHFIIQEDIIDFIEKLPRWLRSIKREITRRKVEGREIQGHIRWGETYETRYRRNYKDTSLFVSADPEKEYNIPENLLLKLFLSILYEAMQEVLEEYLGEGYTWLEAWQEKEEEGLAHQLKRTFERNVHLSRIKAAEEIDLHPRAVQKSRQSRKPLYREAAKHYTDYQRYQRGDEKKLQKLLKRTAIQPENTWRLFEIYFLLRLVKRLRTLLPAEVEQRLVKKKREWTALFTDDNGHVVRVYYNQLPDDITITPPQGERREMVRQIYGGTLSGYFGAAKRKYTARPDALVTFRTDGALKDLLLFEVKYSSRKETIFKGIKELSEYLCFIRAANGEYVFQDPKKMQQRAALVIKAFPADSSSPTNNSDTVFPLLSYADIENGKLTTFLQASGVFDG